MAANEDFDLVSRGKIPVEYARLADGSWRAHRCGLTGTGPTRGRAAAHLIVQELRQTSEDGTAPPIDLIALGDSLSRHHGEPAEGDN
jgi:hypothetical protein